MSFFRLFVSGFITALLIVGSLLYWYLPNLQIASIVPSAIEKGDVYPIQSKSTPIYIAQPFATPLSTDCSQYDPNQALMCESDLANTLYSQFIMLTPTEQLVYDCMKFKIDTQKSYCENRKLAIPLEQKRAEILEKAKSAGISACREFGSGSEEDRCQIDVALGRLPPSLLLTQSGLSIGPNTRIQQPLGCEILDANLRIRCDRELGQLRQIQ